MTQYNAYSLGVALLGVPVTGVSKPNPELASLFGLIFLQGMTKGMVAGMAKGMEIAGHARPPSVMEGTTGISRGMYIPTTSSPRDSGQIIRERVRDLMSDIPEVEHVCVKKEAHFYRVWTIVRERNDRVDETIYSRELDIMDSFEEVPFDFLVIHREERDLEDILPQGGQIIYSKL